LGKRTAHAFAHARLAGMSRDLVPRQSLHTTLLSLHTTLLRAARTARLRAARTARHRYRSHAILEFYKGQESPCSSQTFGCHDEVMVSSLCMDCKYGL